MAFQYDAAAKRYRDATTGKFVPKGTINRFRDDMIDQSMARIDDLTSRMLNGGLSLDDWRLAMRAEIKTTTIAEYLLGRGGRNAMTQSDWGKIGAELRKQYRYLERFAAEIHNGTLSDKEIAARARMYTAGANSSFGRGQASAWRVQLPAYPGDGSTQCKSYCRCSWVMSETDTEIMASWTLGGSKEKCPDCQRRARTWDPLVFDRMTGIQKVAA